ncbi:MAG: hypothetical protein JSV17_05980 [Candidatus Aminicenantes bacterium]|nr:MAG: hypothetical protein JSV17_05980 [Candidatus Aminicenantes bacterium]
MILKKPSFLFIVCFFLVFLAWVGTPICLSQQEAEQSVTSNPQEKQEPEKIIGAPQDAKQKMGIWVFVGWMWISVLVLIFFLRLKIKEVDRLCQLRFFSAKKD